MRSLLIALTALAGTGCATLDSFVHNPVHCSIVVEQETCTWYEHSLDNVCLPCDEPYDWGREDYEWIEGTMDAGTPSVRPIPQASVVPYRIATDDGAGELDAYFLPSHGGVPEYANTTVLYSHGNYGSIEHYMPRIRFLHEAGFNVIAYDYRGYGKSVPEYAPAPSEFLADAVQVRAWADDIVPDADRIIIYAFSVGTIPAVEQSVAQQGCATFLEAPFVSLSAAAQANSTLALGEQFFSEGLFDNASKLQGFDGPLLGMAGDKDNKFPIEDMTAMIEGSAGPHELWVLPGVMHDMTDPGGGVPEDGLTPYFSTMRTFLDTTAPACLTPVE